tara:strand:- start:9148 stop:9438 length:291 start_codon:yes stop_codon:yes gene_type:complete
MNISKINTFRSLNNRNKLQQQALRNRHTFKKELYIDIDNSCLVIKVVVGGEEKGIVYYKYVYEGDCFFKELNELYADLLKEYDKTKKNIDSDLIFV